MKKLLSIALLTSMASCLGIIAQAQDENNKNSNSNDNANNIVVAQGATARLSLQSQLSTKISEVGDEVVAVLYEPVRGSDGRVAIPRGTEFVGRVTQVQAAKRPQKEATMTVVFEVMRMPYGEEKVATTVTAIDDYASDEKYRSKDDEGKVGGGRSGERTARNAGLGGGLGSLGGVLAGGIGAVAVGAGAGAATGVLMTKGKDIKLAPGTILRVRFDREVTLPVS